MLDRTSCRLKDQNTDAERRPGRIYFDGSQVLSANPLRRIGSVMKKRSYCAALPNSRSASSSRRTARLAGRGLLVVHARSGMTERGFCWPGSDCRRAVSERIHSRSRSALRQLKAERQSGDLTGSNSVTSVIGLLGDGIDADIRRCAPKRLETGSDIIFEQVARQVGLCMLG